MELRRRTKMELSSGGTPFSVPLEEGSTSGTPMEEPKVEYSLSGALIGVPLAEGSLSGTPSEHKKRNYPLAERCFTDHLRRAPQAELRRSSEGRTFPQTEL